MSGWIENLYLYGKDYTDIVLAESRRIKQEKGDTCESKDFEHLDIIHPAGHTGIDLFVDNYEFKENLLVLDIGCGIGGTSRYLSVKKGWRFYGSDYLQHYIDAAKEITEYANLSKDLEFHQGDILSTPLPEQNFDLGICIGVFMYIPDGIEGFRNIYRSLKPGALLYWEDYYLLKEREERTPEEVQIMIDFPMPGIRSKNRLLQEMESVGFELVEWAEFGKDWSEFAWDRAEKFLSRYYSDSENKPLEGEVHSYGRLAPQILKQINHLSSQEIKDRWPVTSRELDSDKVVFNTPHFMGVSRVVFKKPEA